MGRALSGRARIMSEPFFRLVLPPPWHVKAGVAPRRVDAFALCVSVLGTVTDWTIPCGDFNLQPSELEALSRLKHRRFVRDGLPAPFFYAVWAPTNAELCETPRSE